MTEHTPATPAAQTDQSVRGLAARWWRHTLALIYHRHGLEVLDRAALGAHALAALAAGQALIRDLQGWRPALVVDALAAGVDPDTVARAAGFRTPADMGAWLVVFATEQHRLELMDDTRYRELLTLAERAERGADS